MSDLTNLQWEKSPLGYVAVCTQWDNPASHPFPSTMRYAEVFTEIPRTGQYSVVVNYPPSFTGRRLFNTLDEAKLYVESVFALES